MTRRPFTVALLGAESTGKSQLAQALAVHVEAHGIPVAVVAEHLRTWCDALGRTPRRDEQDSIAAAQARAIERQQVQLARGRDAGARAWLIADTTPLMTAIYSHYLFGDTDLMHTALAFQREQVDLTLLLGLDLPWVADGLQRDGAHVRAPVDALLRTTLTSAGLPHAVVYGRGPQRLEAALRATRGSAPENSKLIAIDQGKTSANGANPSEFSANRHKTSSATASAALQAWCDRCSDPDCELRLFRGLASQ